MTPDLSWLLSQGLQLRDFVSPARHVFRLYVNATADIEVSCRTAAGAVHNCSGLLAGASDCATPVGVMLEAARTFIANPDIRLTAPIIFLFNGAEETLSQAAHGFMAHDK